MNDRLVFRQPHQEARSGSTGTCRRCFSSVTVRTNTLVQVVFVRDHLVLVKDAGDPRRVLRRQHGISGPNDTAKAGPGLLDRDFWRLLPCSVERNVRKRLSTAIVLLPATWTCYTRQ